MGYLEDSASELIANGTLTENAGFSLYSFSSIFMVIITIISFLVPVLYIFPPVPATESDFLNQTHRKIGVDSANSGLKSQYSRSKDGRPRVHSLWVYPVKSCAGIEVERSRVLPTGLQYDRLFMFAQLRGAFPVSVDASMADKTETSWEMATLRQFPRMANVVTEIWVPDEGKLRGKLNAADRPTESYALMRFPWQDKGLRGALQLVAAKLKDGAWAEPTKEILLPLEFPSKKEMKGKGYEMENVQIWKDNFKAMNMQSEVPDELQRYLGVSNKLTIFRFSPSHERVIRRNAPTKKAVGYQPQAVMQDAYPINLLNVSSVQALAEKIEKDENIQRIDVRRFRANIIIQGAPAYEEETWKRMHIAPEGSADVTRAPFDVCSRCVRCTLPNVDPDTGIRHKSEPDRALRKFREVDSGAPKKGCMGMNLVPLFDKTGKTEDMETLLEVGMTIDVTERGDHVYIKI